VPPTQKKRKEKKPAVSDELLLYNPNPVAAEVIPKSQAGCRSREAGFRTN
jgi:hypothetical protein